ncbi:MAG: hypothetical protein HRT72_13420 [Flavobacteriales bacterium]|nr:hypothetical protein [Flavobacteriales bacterium]
MELIGIPIVFILICIGIGLYHRIKMYVILKSKGVRVENWRIDWTEYSNFWKLISIENDVNIKSRYKYIFWIQMSIIPFCITGLILHLIATQ